jgi:hypothetical protein
LQLKNNPLIFNFKNKTMQQVGNFNNVSKELLEKIPPLKGEAVFQVLGGRPNPDEVEAKKIPVIYPKTQLLTKFRIRDPYKKENPFVDIVLAKDWVDNKPTTPKLFVAGMHDIWFGGKFSFSEGNAEDEELYEVFMLSPEREGSPCADKAIKPKFKLLNVAAESKAAINKTDVLFEALSKAKDIDEKTAADIMASQGNSFGTPDELKAAIREFARTYPDKFLLLYKDPQTSVKAEIKAAFDKEILTFQPTTLEVLHGDAVLCKLTSAENYMEGFHSWVSASANGKQVLDAVRKQLKPKKADKEKTEEIVA